MKLLKMYFFLILFSAFNVLKAETVFDTLYINSGEFSASESVSFPYIAFNNSPVFKQQNVKYHLKIGDSLILHIINQDVIQHGFQIKDQSVFIDKGSNQNLGILFDEFGIFPFYDPTEFPNQKSMGLSGYVVVDDWNKHPFYWNIKEHQVSFIDEISNGNSNIDWNTYYPDYFTINGVSNPKINEDPTARVTGNVGDTIRIYIMNSGQSIHSLHFHGYHSTIIHSSKFKHHVGRSKDTFPVLPMESLILELVPHQPGEYPVHDHNLVAVSGAKIYPNGMFLTMLIN